ncbi:hypothetical protein CYMTET_37476 [Cymbomonas tetramitiformis]|uniref:LysM domain-containing protein n=1 Tax=Cymbomonas tetramitiformis TaxID=36881 RepID=A0AAE0F6M1_9CHLO|nr:hypothetical protein CYMTET_37476 [Cymbomonas tetramitiformis]
MEAVTQKTLRVCSQRHVLSGSQRLNVKRVPVAAPKRSSVAVHASLADLSGGIKFRPYTVRQGDWLTSIANKRGLGINEIRALNPGLDDDKIVPGQTILLPAGRFSQRDLEILSGIGTGPTRIYPVRKGETIEAIAASRGIALPAVEELNPTVDIYDLSGGENILLPAGQYSMREKEVLSTVMPGEALQSSPLGAKQAIIGGGLLVACGFAFALVFRSPEFQKKLDAIRSKYDQ